MGEVGWEGIGINVFFNTYVFCNGQGSEKKDWNYYCSSQGPILLPQRFIMRLRINKKTKWKRA